MTEECCIALLCDKYAALRANGLERYPQKNDFTNEEVADIKARLGPWPRALEAAGIKPLKESK